MTTRARLLLVLGSLAGTACPGDGGDGSADTDDGPAAWTPPPPRCATASSSPTAATRSTASTEDEVATYGTDFRLTPAGEALFGPVGVVQEGDLPFDIELLPRSTALGSTTTAGAYLEAP